MKTWKENSRLPFRATERQRGGVRGCFGGPCLAGCEQPLPADDRRAALSTTAAHPDPAEPVPGVETTLPDHIPPNALACFPSPAGSGRMTVASVPDPVAPRLTVSLPDGWTRLRAPVIAR